MASVAYRTSGKDEVGCHCMNESFDRPVESSSGRHGRMGTRSACGSMTPCAAVEAGTEVEVEVLVTSTESISRISVDGSSDGLSPLSGVIPSESYGGGISETLSTSSPKLCVWLFLDLWPRAWKKFLAMDSIFLLFDG